VLSIFSALAVLLKLYILPLIVASQGKTAMTNLGTKVIGWATTKFKH